MQYVNCLILLDELLYHGVHVWIIAPGIGLHFVKWEEKGAGEEGGGGGLVTHGIFDATQILKGIENQQLEGIFPFPTWFRDLISFLTRSVLLMSLVRIVLYPY